MNHYKIKIECRFNKLALKQLHDLSGMFSNKLDVGILSKFIID